MIGGMPLWRCPALPIKPPRVVRTQIRSVAVRKAFLSLTLLAAACSPAADHQSQPSQSKDKAMTGPMIAPILTTPEAKDVKSYARPAEARVTHVALNLRADFEAKRISGWATLDVEAAPNARE